MQQRARIRLQSAVVSKSASTVNHQGLAGCVGQDRSANAVDDGQTAVADGSRALNRIAVVGQRQAAGRLLDDGGSAAALGERHGAAAGERRVVVQLQESVVRGSAYLDIAVIRDVPGDEQIGVVA